MKWKIPGSGRMWRGKTQNIEIQEWGDSLCSRCLKLCFGCCYWAVSNKAVGVMALKNFSSLGWRNRVLFLRAQLQVKPEFPRRGASRWSGIVLGQKSVLNRVDMTLATGVSASHKPWRLFHQINTWSRSLSPWNFSFCIFCFLFLSTRILILHSVLSFSTEPLFQCVLEMQIEASLLSSWALCFSRNALYSSCCLSFSSQISDWASQDSQQRCW